MPPECHNLQGTFVGGVLSGREQENSPYGRRKNSPSDIGDFAECCGTDFGILLRADGRHKREGEQRRTSTTGKPLEERYEKCWVTSINASARD